MEKGKGAPKAPPARPPGKDEVICEKGRHVGCLHDRARRAKGSPP